ncbi:MAG: PIN domain-containing protein [Phycisphaerales bacterium]|nr:PIN domain-containing protein [Phycisphaerales bacterium]
MILVDTSVLVSYLRSASPAIREVFASTDCGICGVTRAEILHGARTPEDAKSLCDAMDVFNQVPLLQSTWDHLGNHLAALRIKGLPMPFQDVLLATIAIDNDFMLWSYDAHFRTIQDVLSNLKLFDGPVG